MPKAWSLEEIRRRWQVVRQRMKESQLDCLLVSQHHSGAMIAERQDGDADVEWLTGNSLPFKFVVFPLEGPVTAISTGQVRGTTEEKQAAERGIDIRVVAGDGLWSAALIESLREKGMAQARVGVTNLVNAPRQPEGEINYTTYDRVLKAFPRATFEATGGLLWRAKMVHSPEEIAVLEKATQVGEIGLEAMFETAGPGVLHRVVWLAMYQAMVNASGERPWRVSFRAGGPGNSALNRPLEEVMRAGQVLSQEISGCVLGYGSQVNHSVLLGSPAPADWAPAAQASLDAFNEIVDAIARGKRAKEICAPFDRRLAARGLKPGALVIHSGGLGDLPRGGSAAEVGELILEAGMVFDIKPSFPLKDGATAQFGDSVVVTEKGARRLGKRELKVMTI
jgi:Xaa-Pro aminopeptidase